MGGLAWFWGDKDYVLCASPAAMLLPERADCAAGLHFSVLSSLCTIAAYYYIQPLSDTLALAMGLEFTPMVTVGNVILIAALNPLYAAAVRVLPRDRIMPTMFRAVCTVLLAFAAAFALLPTQPLVSYAFAVYVGTLSLFTTTTLNARLASLHTKSESKRLYGFIAAGSQAGQLASSLSAPLLYGALGNLIVLCSTLLYELSVQFMLLRSRRRAEPPAVGVGLAEAAPLQTQGGGGGGAGGSGAGEGGGGGGGMRAALASACRGFAILAGSPFLRAMTGQTLLTTFVVAGVWYERAAAVSAAFASSEEQYAFFSRLNAVVSVSTLVVQTLCFAAVLKTFGFHRTLVLEPIAVILGLGLAIVQPGILSIAVLDGMRKAIHYALCKPTKEGLYAAMPQDVVFVAKPLLDTLVYRAGSLVCAAWFEAAIAWGLTSRVRQYSLLAVAALWVANSFWVGLLAEREQEAREGAKAKANGRAAML